MGAMSLLGEATVVSAQTGRKVSNALTLTFKTAAEETLATAVQAGSMGVLLGFRNGGAGHYKITGARAHLTVECANARSMLSDAGGQVIGTVEKDEGGNGVLRSGDGAQVLARAAAQRKDRSSDFVWQHALTDGDGASLGALTWIRSRPPTGWDVVNGIEDMYIWWDRAGQSLKVPSLGAHLALDHPVPAALGDLLLATCVDITVGSHSFLER
jgi:hypothetical protein